MTEVVSRSVVSAWKKFLKLRGKVYRYCVRPVPLYCSKTWEGTVADEVMLQSAEQWMIRMMGGVRLADTVCNAELYQKVVTDLAEQDGIVRNHLPC